MPPLAIPDSYWTITPAGFEQRAQGFAELLQRARVDLFGGAGGLLNGHAADLESGLALSDANETTMRAAMSGEYNVTRDQATGEILARYGFGDDLAQNADASTPPTGAVAPGTFPYPDTPGDPPPDQ